MDLDSYFDHASDCIDSLVYTIDDGYYLSNNITLKTNWSDPLLNLSAMISGNFSDAVLNCFEFGYSTYIYELATSKSFGNFGNWALAFLFNQMGNALAFKSIFDDITTDKANGYTTDIAY